MIKFNVFTFCLGLALGLGACQSKLPETLAESDVDLSACVPIRNKAGKWGLSCGDSLYVKAVYEKVYVPNFPKWFCLIEAGNTQSLYDAKGRQLLHRKHGNMRVLENPYDKSKYLILNFDGSTYELLDETGKVLIPSGKYKGFSESGYSLLGLDDKQLYTVWDSLAWNGKTSLAPFDNHRLFASRLGQGPSDTNYIFIERGSDAYLYRLHTGELRKLPKGTFGTHFGDFVLMKNGTESIEIYGKNNILLSNFKILDKDKDPDFWYHEASQTLVLRQEDSSQVFNAQTKLDPSHYELTFSTDYENHFRGFLRLKSGLYLGLPRYHSLAFPVANFITTAHKAILPLMLLEPNSRHFNGLCLIKSADSVWITQGETRLQAWPSANFMHTTGFNAWFLPYADGEACLFNFEQKTCRTLRNEQIKKDARLYQSWLFEDKFLVLQYFGRDLPYALFFEDKFIGDFYNISYVVNGKRDKTFLKIQEKKDAPSYLAMPRDTGLTHYKQLQIAARNEYVMDVHPSGKSYFVKVRDEKDTWVELRNEHNETTWRSSETDAISNLHPFPWGWVLQGEVYRRASASGEMLAPMPPRNWMLFERLPQPVFVDINANPYLYWDAEKNFSFECD